MDAAILLAARRPESCSRVVVAEPNLLTDDVLGFVSALLRAVPSDHPASPGL
ncbi:hypothetical protein [Streptomyces sp. NPDC047061]|uniref:hypothetical protein n=1 Tax=Streptomyces sp. NPDC047061 TaxID=3154605 RepID=UPI00340A5FAC